MQEDKYYYIVELEKNLWIGANNVFANIWDFIAVSDIKNACKFQTHDEAMSALLKFEAKERRYPGSWILRERFY